MNEMIEATIEIANNGKLPVSIVDWACNLHDLLTDRKALVKVNDLILISAYIANKETGLYCISRAIVS